MRPFGRGLVHSWIGGLAVPGKRCVNVRASFFCMLMKKLKTREQLEKSIKEQLPYYRGVDLGGHNEEQLRTIIERHERVNGEKTKKS